MMKYTLLLTVTFLALTWTNLCFSQNLKAVCEKTQTYVIVIGVADYKYKSDLFDLDLFFADDDASLFYETLKKDIPENNMVLLIDKDARLKNIIRETEKVFSKAAKDDRVIFFFSGHGDEYGFLPYDYKPGEDIQLSFEELKRLFRSTPASQKLCIVDACKSGTGRKGPVGSGILPVDSKGAKSPQDPKGSSVVLFMSSRSEQLSAEDPDLQHGIFSYFIIKGMEGEADANQDRVITLREIYEYTRFHVMEKTLDFQVPVIWGNFDENAPFYCW
jgi:uncharacterized caspase-like protein